MFSGIVETTSTITAVRERDGVLECSIARPHAFDDVKTGDSIAIDGVCLTLEKFDGETLTFALGPETLKVTGWSGLSVLGQTFNLERSLRLNDRIHGHLVTGHVDAVAQVRATEREGETLRLAIEIPKALQSYIWPKGSITVNGVSLTVNEVKDGEFQVWLIPETLKRTNLGRLEKNWNVNLEIDNMARGLVHIVQTLRSKESQI